MPAIFAGVAFFVVENVLSRPGIAYQAEQAARNFPPIRPVVQHLSDDPARARATAWAMLLLMFFRIPQGVLAVMVIALIAPPLIAQDFRSRAFLLYFSRPITRLEYVAGKMATVAAYLAMITVVPGLALYLLGVGLSPNLGVVWDTWDLPFRVIASSVVVIIPTVTFALCLSALLGESRFATFCWFAPWVMGFYAYIAMTAITDTSVLQQQENPFLLSSKWSILSPYHALGEVQSWIFGVETNFTNVAPEAFMLSVVTLVSMAVLLRRVSSPMRI
jgi:ABC-type transport system involved in multi-copper enzyme maturation permease subunit